MGLSAKEAAELVGMSKAGILKAIKSGKVSAQKDINGQWEIQPVELFRVYTPVSASPQASVRESMPDSTASLQREIDLLREMVGDLRSRLDAEVEERRKLTLILTEARSVAPAQQPPTRRSWWARLLGGGA